MKDYTEIYNEAASVFAQATGAKLTPELLFIDQFTDLKVIEDALKRNQVPIADIDLAHFDGLQAEALFGEIGNVLAIRIDAEGSRQELIHAILHELARQLLHERETVEFTEDDAFIAAGYEIWSEFAAEMLARAINVENIGVPMMLYELDPAKFLEEAQLRGFARYAVEVCSSFEGRTAKGWPDLAKEMQAQNLPMQKIVRTLFGRIKTGNWDIDEPWLGRLGADCYIEYGLKA
ncbi:MAG: hypothetical protein IJ109_07555 [Firmicutes bacterium]|nr:hypothetical protein [Bacillota bacterium]